MTICGGRGDDIAGGPTHSDCNQLNPSTNRWVYHSDMDQDRAAPGSAFVQSENRWWVLGE